MLLDLTEAIKGAAIDEATVADESKHAIFVQAISRPPAPSPQRSTVIDLVEPDPAPEPQSASDADSDSEPETEPGFEIDGQSGGHINDEQGFALDPELEAELVAKISSPTPENPAVRDVNLIYRRAIRIGLNALKT